MKTDLIIIGAGPAGLSLALSLAKTAVDMVIIDKQSDETLSNFEPDGRDIALTHFSKKLLENLDVWDHIPHKFISPIKEAKVIDGNSEYVLDFNDEKSGKESLGFLISNHALKEAIYKKAMVANNLTKIFGASVKFIGTNNESACVVLSNDIKIEASLIIAADGRFSPARSYSGIKAHEYDFNQKAIVCKMAHNKPHNNIAYECFFYGGTLAVLPLAGNVASIVITAPTNQSDLIASYSEEQFNSYVENRFKNKLGKMKLMGKRYQYPLIGVYAERFVSNRFALVGDAAVGMHPVTAHGFNLGLKGQNTLAELIKKASEKQADIGDTYLLEKYQCNHHRACRPLYLGTNAIVRLFTNDGFLAKLLRKIALRVGNNCNPFKKIVIKQLTQTKTNFN